MTTHELGTGVLTWDGRERISDRYGTVYLVDRPQGSPFQETKTKIIPLQIIPCRSGVLIAEIIETRQSQHIGDIFRGLFPSTPEVGDRIILGAGELFFERDTNRDGNEVGIKPDDGRESDWLDPRALYRAHDQTVKLLFIEDK